MLFSFSLEHIGGEQHNEIVTVTSGMARRRFNAKFNRELVEQAPRSDVSLAAVGTPVSSISDPGSARAHHEAHRRERSNGPD